MARGNDGNEIKYIYLDTDFFDKEKIFLIEKFFGYEGIVIAIRLLLWIAQREGWGVKWGSTGPAYFAKCGIGDQSKEKRVKEIVAKLVEIGYFDAGAFEAGFLTSKRIIKDWKRTIKACHREIIAEEIPEYIAGMISGEIRENNEKPREECANNSGDIREDCANIPGNIREDCAKFREECANNPENFAVDKIRLDIAKAITPPTPPKGRGRAEKKPPFLTEDGLSDQDREIIHAWNRSFPEGDPRHLPGPPYPINGLFGPNLDKALKSGLTKDQIIEAFGALKKSDRSWQLHSAVKPDNVRFLLTEAQKTAAGRSDRFGSDKPGFGKAEYYD